MDETSIALQNLQHLEAISNEIIQAMTSKDTNSEQEKLKLQNDHKPDMKRKYNRRLSKSNCIELKKLDFQNQELVVSNFFQHIILIIDVTIFYFCHFYSS